MSSPADHASAAARRIAPLWPLKHFVAANPYLGLSNLPFEEAAARVAEASGARLMMPRSFYADAIADGTIHEGDLEAVTQGGGAAGLARAAEAESTTPTFPTLAAVAGNRGGTDWPTVVTDRISSWAAGYFDQGQAVWSSPFRSLSPYEAWRQEAVLDRTTVALGLPDLRARIRALPASAGATLELASERLDLPQEALERYFHRLLMTVGGWAGFARFLDYQKGLTDPSYGNPTVVEVLAVRAAWELLILDTAGDDAFPQGGLLEAWRRAVTGAARPAAPAETDALLHRAYERASQRRLVGRLAPGLPSPAPSASPRSAEGRASVQAAFCIDVRSEPLRRAFEAQDDSIETIGFAGFFGVAMELVQAGERSGGAQCPALLSPTYVVRETAQTPETTAHIEGKLGLAKAAKDLWKAFKLEAVSCFGFVETVGPSYAGTLLRETFTGRTPATRPDGVAPNIDETLLEAREERAGIPPEDRVAIAEGILRGMSLTRDFARVVLLAGHGSSSANNPYASALDCGACGGHSGDANATAAAAVLNDPAVRVGLQERGIDVPADCWFGAALHDTTTDEVRLLTKAPETHAADIRKLRAWLDTASENARRARAPRLGLPATADGSRKLHQKSRDWSEVRPEWGLAGCEALIIAPRERTRGLDLGGRVFLQSYDPGLDPEHAVLNQLMNAPMVVATWINLQYFASSVAPEAFGSGNKTLHNVVGGLGVLEGSGGDLRAGLPMQSVSDGQHLTHDPVRLTTFLEAAEEAIEGVIATSDGVRDLVSNGWLHLMRIDPETGALFERSRGGEWQSVAVAPAAAASAAA